MPNEQKHFRNRNKRNVVKFHVSLGYCTLRELLLNFCFPEWASVNQTEHYHQAFTKKKSLYLT